MAGESGAWTGHTARRGAPGTGLTGVTRPPEGSRRAKFALKVVLLVVAIFGVAGFLVVRWAQSEFGSGAANATLDALGNSLPHDTLVSSSSNVGADLCYLASCIQVDRTYDVGPGESFSDARRRIEGRLRAAGYTLAPLSCDYVDTPPECMITGDRRPWRVEALLTFPAGVPVPVPQTSTTTVPATGQAGGLYDGISTPPPGDPPVVEVELTALQP